MYITPPSQNVALNASDVSITVGINNVSDLVSWEFTVSYDPSVLTYVSAQQDQTLLATIGSPYCPAPIIDEVGGSVRMGCLAASHEVDTPGANGSGTLGTITFAPKANGSSPLYFTRLELGDSHDLSILPVPAQGVIQVGSGSALQPTPTTNPVALTPTAAAGQPTPDPGLTLGNPGSNGGGTGTGSTTGSGSVSGAGGVPSGTTAGSGSQAASVRAAQTASARSGVVSNSGKGAPHAGDGSATQASARNWGWPLIALSLAIAGVTLAEAGWTARRNQ